MLGMSQNRDDASRCRYCGEKLSLIQRLSRAEFCNARHKEAYQQDQDTLAISRLQQLVIEEREAELQGRLSSAPSSSGGGEWPEEEIEVPRQPAPASSAARPAPARDKQPVRGVEYEDPEEAKRTAALSPPCGVVLGQAMAALGRLTPQPVDGGAEQLPLNYKVPEFDAGAQTPRLEPAGESEFRHVVDSQLGNLNGKATESKAEPPSGDFRYPGLRVEAGDWREALQRLRDSYAGIPPLAGLIQIAGPQTLRFEARVKSPLPQPEQPISQPVRSYKPGLARGAAVPGMAGAIGGLGTWRTRFGSEGNMIPQWVGDTVEMTVAADWMPRYPVFYTTSPWDGEGFEAAFGLGAGRGAGEGGDGVDYVPPGNVIAVLDNIERAAEAPQAPASAGGGHQAAEGFTDAPPPAASPAAGRSERPSSAGWAARSAGANTPAKAISERAEGALNDVLKSDARGAAGGSGGGAGAASAAGKGQGRGPGLFKGRATGSGIGDGAGTGTGDGRGSVSVEAVAALVKAARQSDRSRAPLRDLDIRLIDFPAAPRMAAPQPWRGLVEGSARHLPDGEPIWTKQPIELRSLALPLASIEICEAPAALPAPACVLARRLEAPAVPPQLSPAPEQFWPAEWLRPVEGLAARRTVAAHAQAVPPTVNVPPFVAPPLRYGRASQVQPPVGLPEPWVNVQERDPFVLPVALTPAGVKAETRKPVRQPGEGIGRADGLSFGRIERPGGQWVLMRGSNETATFRLALDHLGPQESRPAMESAQLGPVARHAPGPGRAAIPPPRGIVFRDLALQVEAVKPWLEPVGCQFGSVRGGLWESRT